MEDILVDDSSVEEIEWSYIEKVKHLDPTKTYQKLLNEINKYLEPQNMLDLVLDYDSMKLLINQAYQFNIPFIHSNELKAVFILKNRYINVQRSLLADEGYTDAKQTAKIVDYALYRKICALLEPEMNLADIRKYRIRFLEEVLANTQLYSNIEIYPELYLFEQDNYYGERYRPLEPKEIADNLLLDYISDYFFDDYYKNVYLDISQIVKYVYLTDSNLIPQDRLDFYQFLYNLEEYTREEHIAFFQNHKHIKIMEAFYDDIRALKDVSYKSLVDSCTKFTKDSPLYNAELSEKYGCEIYYLNGEEFYGFVRSDAETTKYVTLYTGGEEKIMPLPQPVPEQVKRLGSSFTYIGAESIKTYKPANEQLTMFYEGIDYRNIGHVYHNDSFSSPKYHYFSDFTNELHTPSSLLKSSTSYPEIFIKDTTGIEPTALICIDNVTEWDIEFSKRNNMPIVVINSLKYKKSKKEEFSFGNMYKR